MLLISILLAILTIGTVSAIEDNSTDSNIETLIDENAESVNGEIELENNSNDEVNVLEKSNEDTLANNEESILKSNPDDLSIDLPKEVEFKWYDDFYRFSFHLPKDSKGLVSIYTNDELVKNFNLSDYQLKHGGIGGNYSVLYNYQGVPDEYIVYVNLDSVKISKTKITVKYDDGVNVIEKSGFVDIILCLRKY